MINTLETRKNSFINSNNSNEIANVIIFGNNVEIWVDDYINENTGEITPVIRVGGTDIDSFTPTTQSSILGQLGF